MTEIQQTNIAVANVTKLAKRIRVGIVLLAQTLDEACKDKGGKNA